MKYIIIILVSLLAIKINAQKNYYHYSIKGATAYFGITYERTFLSEKLGTEFSLGLISTGLGAKLYLTNNTWKPYIGTSHYLFLIPNNAGWKTYFPIGLSKKINNNKLSFDIGTNINWLDRNPNYKLNFGIRYGLEF
jgi:hypothetical protein